MKKWILHCQKTNINLILDLFILQFVVLWVISKLFHHLRSGSNDNCTQSCNGAIRIESNNDEVEISDRSNS